MAGNAPSATRPTVALRERLARSAFRRVLDTDGYQTLNTHRLRLLSSGLARRLRDDVASVETMVIFVGGVKSGGTLLGSLLDAHRHAVIADELDLLRFTEAGLDARQLIALTFRGSVRDAQRDRITSRQLQAYSLAVPGASQGIIDRPSVVGATRAGPSTRRLASKPGLIDELRTRMGERRLRVIHMVRNPRDPIAAMHLRSGRPLEIVTAEFFDRLATAVAIEQRLPGDALRIHYEDLVADPRRVLRTTCDFLGIDCSPSYLDACAGIVDPTVEPHSAQVTWTRESHTSIERRAREHEFLSRYEVMP